MQSTEEVLHSVANRILPCLQLLCLVHRCVHVINFDKDRNALPSIVDREQHQKPEPELARDKQLHPETGNTKLQEISHFS